LSFILDFWVGSLDEFVEIEKIVSKAFDFDVFLEKPEHRRVLGIFNQNRLPETFILPGKDFSQVFIQQRAILNV